MSAVGDLTAEYRQSRGWSPDPGPTTRISVELDRDLVRRLDHQARVSGIPRRAIIDAAIRGMVNEWEAIDADEAAKS